MRDCRCFVAAVEPQPGFAASVGCALTGLETAAGRDEVAGEMARMPRSLPQRPRFAKHRGWLQQELGQWHEAARPTKKPGISSPTMPWDYPGPAAPPPRR